MANEQGITVTGSGRAAAAPDVFVARLLAQATSSVPAEAMERTTTAIVAMRAAAVQRGAEPTTGTIVLRQGYDREGQPHGVVAELSLTLRTDDPAAGGDLVAACVEAGGDEARLEGTSFQHADPAGLLSLAREAAFRDAESRAHELAGFARRGLGAVREVTEGSSGWSPVAAKARQLSLDSPPLDPGQLDAEITVTVSWNWA